MIESSVHLHPRDIIDLDEPQALALGLEPQVHAVLGEVEDDVML